MLKMMGQTERQYFSKTLVSDRQLFVLKQQTVIQRWFSNFVLDWIRLSYFKNAFSLSPNSIWVFALGCLHFSISCWILKTKIERFFCITYLLPVFAFCALSAGLHSYVRFLSQALSSFISLCLVIWMIYICKSHRKFIPLKNKNFRQLIYIVFICYLDKKG